MDAAPFLISFAILIAAIALFFALARGRYADFGIPQLLLRILVALPLLLSAAVLHFLKQNEATAMIPPVVPSPVFIVLLTGVLEIAGAIRPLPTENQAQRRLVDRHPHGRHLPRKHLGSRPNLRRAPNAQRPGPPDNASDLHLDGPSHRVWCTV